MEFSCCHFSFRLFELSLLDCLYCCNRRGLISRMELSLHILFKLNRIHILKQLYSQNKILLRSILNTLHTHWTLTTIPHCKASVFKAGVKWKTWKMLELWMFKGRFVRNVCISTFSSHVLSFVTLEKKPPWFCFHAYSCRMNSSLHIFINDIRYFLTVVMKYIELVSTVSPSSNWVNIAFIHGGWSGLLSLSSKLHFFTDDIIKKTKTLIIT